MRKLEDAPGCGSVGGGAQVLQDNVLLTLKTGSPKLSSSTPGQQTNAPSLFRNSSHHSSFLAHTGL